MQDASVDNEAKKRKVIVADDNRDVNFVIKEILSEYGFQVIQAFDGEEAIKAFIEEKPDLVLLDYRMPRMDGIDVLKEIKANDAHAFVVFMTGEGSEDVAVTAMKAGAEDYITKPISFPELIQLSNKLIKEHDLLLENVRLKARGDAYKNYLVTITETMGEAVITTDAQGKIAFMNSMASKLWRDENNLKGQDLEILFHEAHKDIFNDIKCQLAGGMERYETECVLKKADESAFSGLLTASFLKSEPYSGGIVVVVRDLTDIEEMRRQIVNAEKLASLGKVVEGVAHEIRNSLTSLGGFSRRLDRTITPGTDQKVYVDYIIEDVKRLETMITDIEEYVNYTKIHKPKFALTSIEDVIEEALIKTFASGRFGSVKYIINMPSGIEQINADHNYLVEAFWHLFKNACEAMDGHGSLEITVSMNPNYLIADVMDTGRGIPHEEIKEMFNPFYTSKVQGTGVGLSKVYMIIEEHRGYISAKSILGKGTRIRVYLPSLKSGKMSVADEG
jgi:PAS domain S-box-containing protein